MLTSYSRVTVVSGTRRVDLALPSALPVADVVPQVLRFCAPDEATGDTGEFTLARLGGQSMVLSQSLAEAGVRDGDVIELRTFGAGARAAFVEDVRDAIEDSVDGAGGAWTTRTTVTFAIVGTSVVLAGYLVPRLSDVGRLAMSGSVPAAPEPARTVSALVAATVLVGMTWVASRYASTWTAYLSSLVAAACAFVAGTEIAARVSGDLAAALVCGTAASAVVAAVSRLLSPRATPLLMTSLVLVAGAGLVLAAGAVGVEQGMAVRVLGTLAVLSTGVMPRISIAVGGLSSADYRVRNVGKMSESALNARFQESSGLLLGAVVGVSILVGGVGFWLGIGDETPTQDVWDRLLSLSLAAALLLRSRVFSRVQYMLPLRVAAIVIALSTVNEYAADLAWLGSWLFAALAVAGAAVTGVSILRLSDVSRARVKRYLNILEFIVVVDLVVVTMGAVTLYDWVRGG